MTTLLKSNVRRMQVFLLRHDEYCKATESCDCVSLGRPPRLIPQSLTLPALESITVTDAILELSDVKRAIQCGDVTATTLPKEESTTPNALVDNSATETAEPAPRDVTVTEDLFPTTTPTNERKTSKRGAQ